jgi:hypothetical protein
MARAFVSLLISGCAKSKDTCYLIPCKEMRTLWKYSFSAPRTVDIETFLTRCKVSGRLARLMILLDKEFLVRLNRMNQIPSMRTKCFYISKGSAFLSLNTTTCVCFQNRVALCNAHQGQGRVRLGAEMKSIRGRCAEESVRGRLVSYMTIGRRG